jgi:hypothetical protein
MDIKTSLLKAQFALATVASIAYLPLRGVFLAVAGVGSLGATLALNQFIVEPSFLNPETTPSLVAFGVHTIMPFVAGFYGGKWIGWDLVNWVETELRKPADNPPSPSA